jgi:hypothetical protein
MMLTKNIDFIRLIHEQTHGPYSAAAAGLDPQGNPIS